MTPALLLAPFFGIVIGFFVTYAILWVRNRGLRKYRQRQVVVAAIKRNATRRDLIDMLACRVGEVDEVEVLEARVKNFKEFSRLWTKNDQLKRR